MFCLSQITSYVDNLDVRFRWIPLNVRMSGKHTTNLTNAGCKFESSKTPAQRGFIIGRFAASLCILYLNIDTITAWLRLVIARY